MPAVPSPPPPPPSPSRQGRPACDSPATAGRDTTPAAHAGAVRSGTPLSPTCAYVANALDNTVSVVDLQARQVRATVGVGWGPFGVAVHPTGNYVYVSNTHGDSVSVIHTLTRTVLHVPVGYGPHGVALSPDGARLYVANFEANTVTLMDTRTYDTHDVPVGVSPYELAISPCGQRVYVGNHGCNTISVIDGTQTGPAGVIGTVHGMRWPGGMAVHPSRELLYVSNGEDNSVSVVDGRRREEITAVRVGRGAGGLAVSPCGRWLAVANWEADSVSLLDLSEPKHPRRLRCVPVDQAPRGVSFSADGRELYVTNARSNTLAIVDPAELCVLDRVPVGHGPYSPGQLVIAGQLPTRTDGVAAAGTQDAGATAGG